MDFIELEADTVSDAVTKACRKLKVTADQVEVEVLREGEFEEPYLVRISLKAAAPQPVAPKPAPRPAAPRAETPRPEAPRSEAPRPAAAKPARPAAPPRPAASATVDREDDLGFAIAVLQDFLDTIDFPAQVTGAIKDEQIQLNIDSDDGGTLIGRKGATLNALQHVINAVVRSSNHRVIIDISGYRARSAERLEEIAHRVAQEAKDTGRRVELKPMTPAERRIIHMAIATYDGLATESIGEEPNRRIVIIPPGAPPLPPSREPRRERDGNRAGGRSGSGERSGYGDRDRRPARPGGGDQGRPAARGGVDRWGYTRDIPAEAKAWIDENQTVMPIGGTPAPGNWGEVADQQQQPWVKDQPAYRSPSAANPWAADTEYREGNSAEDLW